MQSGASSEQMDNPEEGKSSKRQSTENDVAKGYSCFRIGRLFAPNCVLYLYMGELVVGKAYMQLPSPVGTYSVFETSIHFQDTQRERGQELMVIYKMPIDQKYKEEDYVY